MGIEEQFNLIAKEYDCNRRRFIPCFDDFYENTTKFIAANIDEPKRVIDLGAGTGLLTYHHLEDSDKIKLFSRIYDNLPSGGLFVNYDQFCAEQLQMNHWFDSYWESHIEHSGLTDKDIELWKERRKLDKECSVEQEVEMLKKCKFNVVKCVYSYQKFSVIVAIK